MAAAKHRRPPVPLLTMKVSGPDLLLLRPLDTTGSDAGSFFRGWSLDQLARLQGVDPVRDPAVLAGGWPDDDDVDEALADIYGQRQ